MNKHEFFEQLGRGLSGLPQEDIDERLTFYGEMIDDRVEDGLTEEEAVAEIGSPDEIASQIISETPLSKLVKQKVKTKRQLKTWEIVLIAVCSPVWVPLLIALHNAVVADYFAVGGHGRVRRIGTRLCRILSDIYSSRLRLDRACLARRGLAACRSYGISGIRQHGGFKGRCEAYKADHTRHKITVC